MGPQRPESSLKGRAAPGPTESNTAPMASLCSDTDVFKIYCRIKQSLTTLREKLVKQKPAVLESGGVAGSPCVWAGSRPSTVYTQRVTSSTELLGSRLSHFTNPQQWILILCEYYSVVS